MSKNGGAAFPIYTPDGCPGMSMLDYFAAHCMAQAYSIAYEVCKGCPTAEDIGVAAYQLANEMLKERTKWT